MWLLEASVRRQIEQAQKAGIIPTAEQQVQFEASHGSLSADSSSRIMVVAGATAEIAIKGVITKAPSFLAVLFGGGNTTYPEIISALAEAERDDNIKEIILAIDSPGGSIDGLFDTIAAIETTKTSINAVVSNTAASAAYAIAAAADKITASNRAARFGSVGIVATFQVSDDEVSIASTDAPKKRPDVTTEEGQAIVREELDALHEIFVDTIAAGRNTTNEKINAEFGQGATLLANEALKRGMIDAIADTTLSVVSNTDSTTTARKGGDNSETEPMDLDTLKASHPGVYAAAVKDGVTQERDRVAAHLTMGEASGDMKTAVSAINEGSGMTASLQATYMAAGMNRADINDRQDDDTEANAGDQAGGEDDTDAKATAGAAILNAAANSCGVEVGA